MGLSQVHRNSGVTRVSDLDRANPHTRKSIRGTLSRIEKPKTREIKSLNQIKIKSLNLIKIKIKRKLRKRIKRTKIRTNTMFKGKRKSKGKRNCIQSNNRKISGISIGKS